MGSHREGARLVAITALLAACASHVPPIVSRSPAQLIQAPPALYLMAEKQALRVEDSLESVGFRIVSLSATNYSLRVRIGNKRSGEDCEATNNVHYALMHRGVEVVDINGRGLTRSCRPGILDEMSTTLAGFFAALQGPP